MNEQIIMWLILIAGGADVLSVIGIAIGILSKFKDLRKAVDEKVDVKELQQKLDIAISENRELQRILKKEIETRTHIREE